MQTTSQRFWAIPELQLALTQHLDGRAFRCIAITSRANHQRFLANGWQHQPDREQLPYGRDPTS
ncbi:hypothetical protein RSAG8_13992, partial [Rhizoctonia solani AG-8 WAC10335]